VKQLKRESNTRLQKLSRTS